MSFTEEKAYAKLNISLDVTGKRPDGYHDMLMVMQTVTLCDEVKVELNSDGVSSASCNLHFVPSDERNLAVKAALKFFEAAGMDGAGAKITLRKHIPVGAGMAGGSSDAAAVLRALNRLCGNRFTCPELETVAARVGSDVPFCVAGGTSLARGRGEILEPLPPLPDCGIVICKPEFSVSTPELFKKLDSIRLRCRPDTAGMCAALADGDLGGVARRMYNVFEDVPDRRMNVIRDIKSRMIDCGALGSIMTGTGSAVFGIFSDKISAEKAATVLSQSVRSCFCVKDQKRLEV